MRRYLVPLVFFGLLAWIYLVTSGATMKVQLLVIAGFVMALPLPAIWAATYSSIRSRWIICACCAVVAFLVSDAAAYLVVFEAEPFMTLRRSPMIYLIGIPVFAFISFLVSWAARPPRDVTEVRPVVNS